MTREEAKRLVCGSVCALMSASASDEIVHDYYDYPEADQARLDRAMSELGSELRRRANARP